MRRTQNWLPATIYVQIGILCNAMLVFSDDDP